MTSETLGEVTLSGAKRDAAVIGWVWYAVLSLFAVLIGAGTSHLEGEPLFFVAAAAVLLWLVPFPGRLVVVLCAGFLIGDRAFAVLMWSGLGLPIFITEAVVAVTSSLLLLKYLLRPSTATLQLNMGLVRKPALVFWSVGTTVLLTSVWHCLEGSGQLVPTLRNAALFYYSIFYLIVLATFDEVRLSLKLTHAFIAVIVLMSIRYLLDWSAMLPDLPGAILADMFVVVATIAASVLFCTLPVLQYTRTAIVLLVLISTAVVFTDIRQGLLGLLCGGLCSYWLLSRFRLMSWSHRKTILIFLALFVGTLVLLWMRKDSIVSQAGLPGRSSTYSSMSEFVPIWSHMINRDFSDTGRSVMWAAFLEDMFQSWDSVVFGVGFDRLFIPEWFFTFQTREILTNKTTGAVQLDPHNSHLNLFYRIGLIGFVAYLFLIQRAFRSSFRYLRDGQDARLKYYTIGYLAALTSVAGQALVGVLFEAPHRGIWFWVLLGVCTCFPRVALADEVRASNEEARA